MTAINDPLQKPDFRPDAFLDRLVYAEPPAGVDLPEPPLLDPTDEVVVPRTALLPASVDAHLRAIAAARNISVEELLTDLAQHAA